MNHAEENAGHSPVKSIFDKFSREKDVKLVYGEPISHDNQCIVPVAKMNYSFGAGSGKGVNNEKDETTQEQGEGGGGFFSVKPLGVYEMKADRVRFKPVIDLKFMFIVFSVLTLGMTLFLRKK